MLYWVDGGACGKTPQPGKSFQASGVGPAAVVVQIPV